MEDYKKLVDPASNIKETRNRPSKPLTAYNLFVHQVRRILLSFLRKIIMSFDNNIVGKAIRDGLRSFRYAIKNRKARG